jgi:uncharacterized protein YggE
MNEPGKLLTAVLVSGVLLFAAGCTATSMPAAEAAGPAKSAAGAGGPTQAPALQTSTLPGRGITVVGVGRSSGTPDVANVSVGVETQAASVQQAVADNRTKMTKLLETLKGLGIADKDISTNNYSVYTDQQPAQPSKPNVPGPVAYRVNNQVQVTVRDVAKLGDVLDKVVEAGANNIYGVNFSVADTSTLESDARAKAMTDAKARAESLAKLAGVNLGEVVSVSEVVGGPIPFARAEAALGGGGTPIQPGSLDVNMSVQVTYAIK